MKVDNDPEHERLDVRTDRPFIRIDQLSRVARYEGESRRHFFMIDS